MTMLRASIASLICIALCASFAQAQTRESERRRPVTEDKARTLPERSMTMEQEAEAKRRQQRRAEEAARREAFRLQQQEALRHRHVVPAPVVIVPATPPPPAPPAPTMGGAAPVTNPATAPIPGPAPTGNIVVSCSAAPACPHASGGYGNVCRSVQQTYGGANAASIGRRDIVTLCQQVNSPETCGDGHPGGPAAGTAYRSSFGGGCVQQCVNAGRCTAQNASFR